MDPKAGGIIQINTHLALIASVSVFLGFLCTNKSSNSGSKRLNPLPFMHSESKLIHEWAQQLYRDNGLQDNYDFELRHKAIIDRFGRFPHRNAVLGRKSTVEEIEFLKQPGSHF